jgi:hypothetical protein
MISLDIVLEVSMVDILVRGVDEETARWLKSIAASENTSLSEVSKQALEEKARSAKTRRRAFLKELAAIRNEIGPLGGDSVADIRAFRESR